MSKDDIYGEGYEKATEPGPDVERFWPTTKNTFDWNKKTAFNTTSGLESWRSMERAIADGELYRQPTKPKEQNMQKSIEELKKRIEDLKQGTNNIIDEMTTKIAMMERELKEETSMVDVFKKLIIKYCPKYEAFTKDNTEFDVIYPSIHNTNRISIKYPIMYTEFSLAIMKATLEFCNEVKPKSKVIFADNRVMTILFSNKE